VARQNDLRRLLSFDMGGTTAKLCLIDDFQALNSRSFEVDRVYRFKKGSGLPVRIPVIEMVEIGAGGGSIAQVDKLQRIQVGPESAGSEPGPAAYGRGGTHPAVTDADVCLGRIYADKFAGGAFRLDESAAKQAVHTHIADPLNLEPDLAALGISEVVDETWPRPPAHTPPNSGGTLPTVTWWLSAERRHCTLPAWARNWAWGASLSPLKPG
jgi:N-methylhydantoinase A